MKNSVATLIVPSRAAAGEPAVVQIIGKAEAIFIAGGDQAEYINFWKGTPMEAALNAAILRGVPEGGTSAGLAVQGEYIYAAQNDSPDDPNLSSKMALMDPVSSPGDGRAWVPEECAPGWYDNGLALCKTRPHGTAPGHDGARVAG